MVMWFNESGTLWSIISYATTNITGELILTLTIIFGIFAVMSFLFKMPSEFSILLLMPCVLGLMAYDSFFLPIGGVMLFMLAIALTTSWLGR